MITAYQQPHCAYCARVAGPRRAVIATPDGIVTAAVCAEHYRSYLAQMACKAATGERIVYADQKRNAVAWKGNASALTGSGKAKLRKVVLAHCVSDEQQDDGWLLR